MFNEITFEKLLEVTVESLNNAFETQLKVYDNPELDYDTKQVYIAEAYKEIEHWSKYLGKYKEIVDSEVEDLTIENGILRQQNNRLTSEVNKLKSQVSRLTESNAELKQRNIYIEQLLQSKDANSNLVSVDLVDMIEKLETIASSYEAAIVDAQHKASMKTFNQRVASGEVKPAKRADVDDMFIVEQVNKGVSAYKIAQAVGMTPQAILYRIKKLKEQGLIQE